MPKAHVTTKRGTTIVIEGSTDEVAELVRKIQGEAPPRDEHARRSSRKEHKAATVSGPMNHIESLIDGGFFRKPKDLASVKVALEEIGHFYPVTSLSPTLLRLVRSRQLRRLRDKKRWMYTG
jgi:hypothetical protein